MLKENKSIKKETSPSENKYAPIAVIGMGCRFPGGANSPYRFWDNLTQAVHSITQTPPDRWNTANFYSSFKEKKGKSITRWGGYIDGVHEFDPTFFGITPREAEFMDPQQRKLLEVTYEALEDGGLSPSGLSGEKVGVFIGGFTADYKIQQFTNPDFENLDVHTATGVMMTMLSNRISYIFDFKGPSMTLDTACSSALVAVDLACKSLQMGDSKLAVAGGAMLQLVPQYTISESKGGFLSPTGWSHNLDESANGYVRSDGVGVVILKPLADAVADGDPIHATIIGSAVNQDGRTNGITVPNGEAQYDLLKTVYHRAGVDPGDVQYIEIHGTGTKVGDPIEANTVGRFLKKERKNGANGAKCYIGSVKTNIGHAESAAGIVSLIKTILILRHKKIPPHLHLENINPAIEMDSYPIRVPTVLTDWPEHQGPAVAGVNSFGFGGTNAHVILRAHKIDKEIIATVSDEDKMPSIFPLTAKDPQVLVDLAQSYCDFIGNNQPEAVSLKDIAYTVSQKKEHHQHKLAIVYSSKADLKEKLSTFAAGEPDPALIQMKERMEAQKKLVWVFTGMGPQWWAMGRQLYDSEPIYKKVIDRCDQEFSKIADWSLIEELLADEKASHMSQTWLSQPANFAVQAGLAALWRSYGVEPSAIVGHSTGEIAAFYEAGVYSLKDACLVAFHRSRLQHTCSGSGKIAAVGLAEKKVRPLLKGYNGKLSVAAINSDNSVSVSGQERALKDFLDSLKKKEIFCKLLRVDIPFHSPLMNPIKEDLIEALKPLSPRKANLPLYSTATGTIVEGDELDNIYWWLNVRDSVYFAKAIKQIIKDGFTSFLEVGPHPVLAASIQECLESMDVQGIVLPSIRRNENERETMMLSLASIYSMGIPINWKALHSTGEFIRGPLYPFRKDHYLIEHAFFKSIRAGNASHPLLGKAALNGAAIWQNNLNMEMLSYLEDHKIQGNIILPAAGYIEMLYAGLRERFQGDTQNATFIIDRFYIDRALFLSPEKDAKIQLQLCEENASFKILSLNDQKDQAPSLHAHGFYRSAQTTPLTEALDLEKFRNQADFKMEREEIYTGLDRLGYNYGEKFQCLDTVWKYKDEILSKIVLNETDAEQNKAYTLHPAMLDASFQSVVLSEFDPNKDLPAGIRLPISIDTVRIETHTDPTIWCHVKIRNQGHNSITADIFLYDHHGRACGRMERFLAKNVDEVVADVGVSTLDSWLYEVIWQKDDSPSEQDEMVLTPGNAAAPVTSGESNTTGTGGWLLFADQDSVGEKLSTLLQKNGDLCWRVLPGERFQIDIETHHVTMPPDAKDDMVNTLTALFVEKNISCKGIIHMWNLNGPDVEQVTGKALEKIKQIGVYSLVQLSKAILESELNTRLWVITRNSQPATADRPLNVSAASAWGLGRVLAQQELTENWGGLIDLDLEMDADEAVRILREISGNSQEQEVAFRGKDRFVPRIMPISGLRPMLRTRLRSDGCYMVTGAYGALGRLVCEMLVQHGARKLLLVSRNLPVDRSQWSRIGDGEKEMNRIHLIKKLESMGAEIIQARIDITNEAEIAEFIEHFKKMNYPPLRGLFYCAGVVQDTLLTNMDQSSFDRVYQAKVMGACALHQHLRSEPLDYFVLFSSVAAHITTAGQTNYASANAFLDALAHHRRALGQPALSINWGPWAVGMIKELGLIDHYRDHRGLKSTLPAIGMKIMDRILDQDPSQVIVCDANWSIVLKWYPVAPLLFSHLAVDQEEEASTKEDDFKTIFYKTPAENRKELTEGRLGEIISQVLRIKHSQIEPHLSLNNMGIDSLIATELRNKIISGVGHSFPVVKLLSRTSITDLATEITEMLNGQESEISAQEEEFQLKDTSTENTLASSHVVPAEMIEDEFPLSFGQKAIWFIQQMNPESIAYNIGGAMHIPQKVDIKALRNAINDIISRHPSLRTNFFIKDGEPFQRVLKRRSENFELIPAQNKDWESIRQQIIRDIQLPFNLEKDPLYRIRLYKQNEESYFFAVSIHHIISDAWSNYMFINEMQEFYANYTNESVEAHTVTVANSYKQFVEWESRMVNSVRGSSMYRYWTNHLPQEIPVLELPTDKPRPIVQTNNGASFSFSIDRVLTDDLKMLARQSEATMFTLLLSIYYTLMHKYTQQEEIIIGSPVAGRTQPDFSDIYGYFVNPLPLTASFKDDPTFSEFIDQVRETVLGGLDNQEFPFALLVERLNASHDASRSAIFQVIFVLLNHRVEQQGMDTDNVAQYKGFPMKFLQVPEEEGQFDITLSMYEENGVYQAIFKYNTDLFHKDTIQRMAGHYLALVKQIVSNPQVHISKLSLLSEREQRLILEEWSQVKDITLGDRFVHNLVEEKARIHPDAVAVKVAMEEDVAPPALSYGELDQKANRLCNYLLQRYHLSEAPVGIYLDKTTDTVLAIIAVWKSGRAFLPLDPTYPEDRIHHMLKKTETRLIISHSGFEDIGSGTETVYLDRVEKELMQESPDAPMVSLQMDDPAYIIFTSGSTGLPKGVKVTHANLLSAYLSWEKEYELQGVGDVHLQMASFSFDVFCGDFVRALCSGGELLMITKNILLNIPRLYQVMQQEKVNRAEFVPAVARNMIQYLQSSNQKLDFMATLIVGSDTWTMQEYNALKQLCGPSTRLINSYGLTEATIDSTYFEGDLAHTEDSAQVPIGKPFPNSAVFVLDRHLNPLPVGIPGNLYIGGMGVCAGYVGDEAQTRQCFIDHNFTTDTPVCLYNTGDIAMWDRAGNIRLLGRSDNQVKIRGHRIELREIETLLDAHPDVRKSVVIIHNTPSGEAILCAYYLPSTPQSSAKIDLIAYLQSKLPYFMLPNHIEALDAFPLTPNGKVDVKRLPVPSNELNANRQIYAPQNIFEKETAKIWSRMLGVRNISLTDDFFHYGGNSLHLIELMVQLQEIFKIKLTVNQLLRTPTLKGMAETIENIVTGKIKGADPYLVFNPNQDVSLHCFPPAGGYSMVYSTLADHFKAATFFSFNYIETENKKTQYYEMIKSLQPEGPYILFGYSIGGNLAFEMASELEKRGEVVTDVIIMDAYRITKSFKPTEEDLIKFRSELKAHFKKHTDSDLVQDHILLQAKAYTEYCYKRKNLTPVNADVHFIIEDPGDHHDPYRKEKETSWNGSSLSDTIIYQGKSRHADMLNPENAIHYANILRRIVASTQKSILSNGAADDHLLEQKKLKNLRR